MKILLVNGYQKHDFCKGELNFSLYNIMLDKLRHNHDVQLSSVENYNIIDERNKFLWADLIIFQFPIYWFNVPGKLKLYMDEVFEYGQFYSFADVYGQGGYSFIDVEESFQDLKDYLDNLSVKFGFTYQLIFGGGVNCEDIEQILTIGFDGILIGDRIESLVETYQYLLKDTLVLM